MRVNISYAIDLDEVPIAAHDLLYKIGAKFNLCNKKMEGLVCQDGNHEGAIKIIDSIRKEMATLDQQLADVAAILAGYQKTTAELYLAEQDRDRQLAGEISSETQELLDQIEENENDSIE